MGRLRCVLFKIGTAILLYAISVTALTVLRRPNIGAIQKIGRLYTRNADASLEQQAKKAKKAYPQQTPHSGRHFLPSHPAYRQSRWKTLFSRQRRRGRFMEGWYYRLTLKDTSFAFIVSIEDPGRPSEHSLACIQVVKDDEYLVQADHDDTRFWAWEKQQGLGCSFSFQPHVDDATSKMATDLSTTEWYDQVESGFQILPSYFLGRVKGHDGSKGGVLDGQGIPGCCDFDFAVMPLCGWGDANSTDQTSTGGWLASFAVFEPHWQVTMADARATGRVVWKNRTYEFEDAPFYAEKNWGKALPSKWYWTQCNSFDGYTQLSITAGGGIRQIPLGQKEALGMICVHYNGTFYEAVPWTGTMDWKVSTWGSWMLTGSSTTSDRPFEVEVSYSCDPATNPGLVFRAPTPDEGMVYFCRDTFEAATTLSLWELKWDEATKEYKRKAGPPLIDQATSSQGGAEVGGGPWWDDWEKESRVKQPIKALLRFPFKLQNIKKRLRRIKS